LGRSDVGISDGLDTGDMAVKQSGGHSILRAISSVKTSTSAVCRHLPTTLQEDLSSLFSSLRDFRRTLSIDDRNKFDGNFNSFCLTSALISFIFADVWGLSYYLQTDEEIGTASTYYNKITLFYSTVIMRRRRPELVLLG
jgi:hypothetical protein